jgi:hypothetical protein
MISSCIHFLANDIFHSSLWLSNTPLCIYTIISLSIRPSVVNSATINTSVQVSLLYADLDSFGYMPRSGVAGAYASSIFSFFEELSY